MQSRFKTDFPKIFRDDDPTTWISQANKYFEFYQTANVDKVLIASIYLEGGVQLWLQAMKKSNLRLSWKLLVEGIFARFKLNQKNGFRSPPFETVATEAAAVKIKDEENNLSDSSCNDTFSIGMKMA
ncbi:hypothetical protein LINGRAHAP2_LOCUS27775 [Linum grandiflorum]